MNLKFPLTNYFYFACFDVRSSLMEIMADAGFQGGLSAFDEYNFPCISVFKKEPVELTESGNLLNMLSLKTSLLNLVLFETVKDVFNITEISENFKTLKAYFRLGFIESISKIENTILNENDTSRVCSANYSFEEFENLIKLYRGGDLNEHKFEIKLTVPLNFEGFTVDRMNNEIYLSVARGFELKMLTRVFA